MIDGPNYNDVLDVHRRIPIGYTDEATLSHLNFRSISVARGWWTGHQCSQCSQRQSPNFHQGFAIDITQTE